MAEATAATPAGQPKRAWKLQEFVAHGASVNCVALGHKSGRVLVTGGDDKKVNLWAVGKPNCIMSLVGHTTPIECVRFGQTEELVVAGSASGALKIWDLEAAKLVRTLTGHKAGLTCADFHPYGDFLASGSADKSLKLWDVRRKGCIFTYKGHTNRVNSLKFSPDGQWIASAGEDAAVRIWDLRAGKLMTEFKDHQGPVFDVEFHPHEFLLASSSQDRTVSYWDLESFCKISCSDVDTGPIRTIVFHPEGSTLFSGSSDSLKIHQWEPGPRVVDSMPMGWGKIRDMAVATTQLIGAAYNMSNVSVYVIDLKRVCPFNGVQFVAAAAAPPQEGVRASKQGQAMRRSFAKEKPGPNGHRPKPQVKVADDQTSSDKSGTDPEDSDGSSYPAAIQDVQNYENIFRPRQRQLNRTPPPDGASDDQPYYEPFRAPLSSSESDNNMCRPTDLRLKGVFQSSKKHSPSPTRRQSQPAPPSGYGGSPVRMRKGSNPATPTGFPQKSLLDQASGSGSAAAANVYLPSPTRGDADGHGHARSSSTPRLASAGCDPSAETSLHLTPVSRIHISQQSLDKPAVVRPSQRTSVRIPSPGATGVGNNSPPVNDSNHLVASHQQLFPVVYSNAGDSPTSLGSRKTSVPISNDLTLEHLRLRAGNAAFVNARNKAPFEASPSPSEKKIEVVPMNADKPTGLPVDDFLPKKFSGLGLNYNTSQPTSKYSCYKDYGSADSEMSESEVTSSILKGHDAMMAVLTTRGRNMEIIQKLWQSKDAKAAIDQAVSLNDQAIMVDLLSVITLRPSIWNLDLCESLLPVMENLLQSKYEMYINVGCGALKLVLKNFASVIKSNIDSPMQTVGVDISREERHRKCMQCYKDLVKIRSLILKRQSMQGKLGHTFRELAILMQYLD